MDDVDHAFEAVVNATGEVQVRGSKAAAAQGDILFAACEAYVNVTMQTPPGNTTPELEAALTRSSKHGQIS